MILLSLELIEFERAIKHVKLHIVVSELIVIHIKYSLKMIKIHRQKLYPLQPQLAVFFVCYLTTIFDDFSYMHCPEIISQYLVAELCNPSLIRTHSKKSE